MLQKVIFQILYLILVILTLIASIGFYR